MNSNTNNNNKNKRGCTGRFCKKLGNKARNLSKKVSNWFQIPPINKPHGNFTAGDHRRGRSGSNEARLLEQQMKEADRQAYLKFVAQADARRILTGEGMVLPTWEQIQTGEYRDPRLPPPPQAPTPEVFAPVMPPTPTLPSSRVYYNENEGINRLGNRYNRLNSNNNMPPKYSARGAISPTRRQAAAQSYSALRAYGTGGSTVGTGYGYGGLEGYGGLRHRPTYGTYRGYGGSIEKRRRTIKKSKK